MTRDETKQIMFLIDNEYPDFMPKQQSRQVLKIDTWYESFKRFDFSTMQKATIKLLHNHEFGTPKLAHMYAVLHPKKEHENLGQEFADRAIALLQSKGAEAMDKAILEEFGKIGYQIWLDNKSYMREMKNSEIPTLKAQMRNRFNSMHERAVLNGDIQLPFEKNEAIMKRLESSRLLE